MKTTLPAPEAQSPTGHLDGIKLFLAKAVKDVPAHERRTPIYSAGPFLFYADSLDGVNWTAYISQYTSEFKFWGTWNYDKN